MVVVQLSDGVDAATQSHSFEWDEGSNNTRQPNCQKAFLCRHQVVSRTPAYVLARCRWNCPNHIMVHSKRQPTLTLSRRKESTG
jgi:hypothetical protein